MRRLYLYYETRYSNRAEGAQIWRHNIRKRVHVVLPCLFTLFCLKWEKNKWYTPEEQEKIQLCLTYTQTILHTRTDTHTDTHTDTPTDKRTHTPTDKHTNTHSRKPLYLESVEREREMQYKKTPRWDIWKERERETECKIGERESECLRECGEGRKDESRRERERK